MKLDKMAGSHNDEFYTPKYAIIPLIKYLKERRYKKIWCPFDTENSNYVKILKENNFNVLYSHKDTGDDFFDCLYDCHAIVSNPPYSLKTKVLERLFALKIPFAMLLGVVGLFESQKRFQMFKNNDFEIMYFDKRISYFKDYNDPKPSLNPPFSSVYVTYKLLSGKIIFEEVKK